MMRSPLIQALIDDHHYALLMENNTESFLQNNDDVVLFFTGNPQQYPESNDVAVILPQLMHQFGHKITAAVVDESAENYLRKRFAFNKWPALVFLRQREYLGVINGMQNWSDFQGEIERILSARPGMDHELVLPVIAEI